MPAVFSLQEQIEICYRAREAQLEGHGRAFPFEVADKPLTLRGNSRLASSGKQRGKRPSHKTAPRLIRGNVAEASARADEAWARTTLQSEVEYDSEVPFFWERCDGSPIVHHPSCAGTWWDDCLRREAESQPACASVLLEAARAVCARREDELIKAIIRR